MIEQKWGVKYFKEMISMKIAEQYSLKGKIVIITGDGADVVCSDLDIDF